MTFRCAHRRAATLLALAFMFALAGTATARPIDQHRGGAKPPPPEVMTYRTVASTTHPATGGSEWAYLAIGGGAVGLALLAIGGTIAVGQHRHRRESPSRTRMAG